VKALAWAVAATALLAAGCDAAPFRPKQDELVVVGEHDAEVNAAISRARETLPVFWKVYEARPAGVDDYSIKVALKTEGGGQEHIWIRDIAHDGEQIRGNLANEPEYLPNLVLGSPVAVTTADVSDWTYRKDGKYYGHFTTRALFRHMDPKEADALRANFSPEPLEPGQP
jgi:uncharacterized protein YegJ (DUF2314 family)